jgi:hypothetical protein
VLNRRIVVGTMPKGRASNFLEPGAVEGGSDAAFSTVSSVATQYVHVVMRAARSTVVRQDSLAGDLGRVDVSAPRSRTGVAG